MAEVTEVRKRNRRRTLPRRCPKIDCPECGGRLWRNGQRDGRTVLTRFLKCVECGHTEPEKDQIDESAPT